MEKETGILYQLPQILPINELELLKASVSQKDQTDFEKPKSIRTQPSTGKSKVEEVPDYLNFDYTIDPNVDLIVDQPTLQE